MVIFVISTQSALKCNLQEINLAIPRYKDTPWNCVHDMYTTTHTLYIYLNYVTNFHYITWQYIKSLKLFFQLVAKELAILTRNSNKFDRRWMTFSVWNTKQFLFKFHLYRCNQIIDISDAIHVQSLAPRYPFQTAFYDDTFVAVLCNNGFMPDI